MCYKLQNVAVKQSPLSEDKLFSAVYSPPKNLLIITKDKMIIFSSKKHANLKYNNIMQSHN